MGGIKSSIFLTLAAALLVLPGCNPAPVVVANHDTVVTLGSAATVKVFAFGDLKITFPVGVGLKLAAPSPNPSVSDSLTLIEAEYLRDKQARTVEAGSSYVDYAWSTIGKDPDRYLVFTKETSVISDEDVNYATGSGFVLTGDGNIVTCQHCVSGGPADGYLNQKLYDGIMAVVSKKIGGSPSDEVMAKSANGLLRFLTDHVQAESVFKEARVLIPQLPKDVDGYNAMTSQDAKPSWLKGYFPSPGALLRKWTWPCTIVATGENWPGKDVAILKMNGDNLCTIGVSEGPEPRPDSTVLCLGFPGKAIQKGAMTREAQYRVILHRGQVGQTLPTAAGFDAIHTNADINYGDSGGPAHNDLGEVIGLSVSGQEDAPGQNFLVPASVILERMKQAGISNSPDKFNQEWKEGLLDLQAKRYSDAKQIFERLRSHQDKEFSSFPKYNGLIVKMREGVPSTINLFLDRAIKDCEEGLKGHRPQALMCLHWPA